MGSPRFLADLRSHALLQPTPVDPRCQATTASTVLPSHSRTGSASTKSDFGAVHTAYDLAVYASPLRLPSTAQDSLPAGGHPWPGGTHTRRVRSEGFKDSAVISDSRHLFPLPQASP